MDKRGVSIIMIIFEILVVILVGFMITEVARGMAKSETTIKINVANDFKMMVDTLVGVPGKAVVEYPGNLSQYTVVLGDGYVSIFKKGDSDVKKVIRNFDLPEGYLSAGSVEQKARACLEKDGKSILLRKCKNEEN